MKLVKRLCLLTTMLISVEANAGQSIWSATDRGPVQGTYRIPVDISSNSSPGQISAAELQSYIFVPGVSQGDIAYFSGTSWAILAHGTSGQVLTTQGASANPIWSSVTGTGTVTTTGSPVSGNLAFFSGGTSITSGNLSGDCTTSGTGAVTCTKTGGVSFAPSATTDTTNAANIASGTLLAARLPNPGATTLGGIESIATVSHQFLTGISTSGVPSQAQPGFSDLSGTATPAQLPVATTGAFGAVKPDGSTITVSGGVLSAVTGGGGSVTSASVVSANGLAGTVANATTTPAITLSTTVTGMVKGNGTALSAATAGTDYSAGTSANTTGIVKSTTGTGALTTAVAGTDYQAPISIPLATGLTTTPGNCNPSTLTSGQSIYPQNCGNPYVGPGTHNVGVGEFGFTDICDPTSTGVMAFTLPPSGTTGLYAGMGIRIQNESTTQNCTVTAVPTINGVTVSSNVATLAPGGFIDFIWSGTRYDATGAQSSGGGVSLSVANAWTAEQSVTPVAVTDSTGVFTPALASSNNQTVQLVHSESTTLANPSNGIIPGTSGVITIKQSATGGDTITTYGSDYIFTNGSAPTLSTAANAIDYLSYYVFDSTHIRISALVSTVTVGSGAAQTLSYQPGLITSVSSTKGGFSKVTKASTVDNIELSASSFTCSGNPTVTFYECGTSTTCASPTTIGSGTVTASGTVVDGTVSNAAITAGDYVAWAITAGTCTSLDIAANAQIHAN